MQPVGTPWLPPPPASSAARQRACREPHDSMMAIIASCKAAVSLRWASIARGARITAVRCVGPRFPFSESERGSRHRGLIPPVPLAIIAPGGPPPGRSRVFCGSVPHTSIRRSRVCELFPDVLEATLKKPSRTSPERALIRLLHYSCLPNRGRAFRDEMRSRLFLNFRGHSPCFRLVASPPPPLWAKFREGPSAGGQVLTERLGCASCPPLPGALRPACL
jgi:hypothetical protein